MIKTLFLGFLALATVSVLVFSCSGQSQRVRGPSGNYYSPQYPREYRRFRTPSSRFYNNPYGAPPNTYYPYYDYDQYYTLPPSYQIDEGSHGSTIDPNSKI